MKLSRILSIALVGTMAFTASAVAGGTKAGTKISNAPTVTYNMGGADKKAVAPVASYVVDKVINFTLTRSEVTEHKVVAGTTKLVEFKLKNIGNSVENFKLSKWHNIQDVKFLSKKFFVDADGDGVLDNAEKVDTVLVKDLAIDASRKIWMELQIDPKAVINNRSDSGLLAEAVDSSSKPYVASAKNRMNEQDIVFADGKYYTPLDGLRDGKVTMWYGFTTTQDTTNVKLDIKLTHDQVWSDPINGTNNPKAIPQSVVRKIWTMTNNTKTDAKNVVFTFKADSASEVLKTDFKGTQFDPKTTTYKSPLYSNNKDNKDMVYGVVKGDTVTYTVPEIKAGALRYFCVYTTVK